MRVRRFSIGLLASIVALAGAPASEARGGRLARVTGRVVFESGAVASGVTVELKGASGTFFTKTSRRGTFRFDKVEPGSYVVTSVVVIFGPPPIFAPDFIGSVAVDLERGDRVNVEIVLEPVQ